jgi:hypothetical protein
MKIKATAEKDMKVLIVGLAWMIISWTMISYVKNVEI